MRLFSKEQKTREMGKVGGRGRGWRRDGVSSLVFGKERGKEEGRQALASKVSGLLLEHCQVTVDSLALLTGEQNCSRLALFFSPGKGFRG